MTDLLLTVDAGSGGCKALVFDSSGKEAARCVEAYATEVPRPGWAELPPGRVVEATTKVMQGVLERVEPERVRGVGISAQLGLVPVDVHGHPVSNILTWMDKRAQAQSDAVEVKLGPERIYSVSGRRVDPEWIACKILWFKDEDPSTYARTHKFLTVKDYLVYRLTGSFVIDETQASYSMLFNVRERCWEDEFFSTLDIAAEKMPDVKPATAIAGVLSESVANEFSLPSGIPVVTGASDGAMAALGAGLINEHSAVSVVGTTDVFHACSDEPVFDSGMRTLVTCHAVPGKWVHGGPMSTTGGCLKWFCSKFAQHETELAAKLGISVYELFDREVAQLAPGAGNLFCIPSLVGERTPFWNPHTRGVLFGLSTEHEKAHVFRAILEGSAYAARSVVTILEEQGVAIERLLMVGGGARSHFWASLRADICNKPVVLPLIEEATCLGSALLAGLAAGIYPSLDVAIESAVDLSTVIEPDPTHRAIYDELYARYARLREDVVKHFEAYKRG